MLVIFIFLETLLSQLMLATPVTDSTHGTHSQKSTKEKKTAFYIHIRVSTLVESCGTRELALWGQYYEHIT